MATDTNETIIRGLERMIEELRGDEEEETPSKPGEKKLELQRKATKEIRKQNELEKRGDPEEDDKKEDDESRDSDN